MNTLTLSLLILIGGAGQYKHPNNNLVPDRVKDLAFMQVQEDWVYQNNRSILYKWTSVLSEEESSLLVRLDCEHLECRKVAQKELAAAGWNATKLLLWGLHAKSGEVKLVCSQRLRHFYRCETCRGDGLRHDDNHFLSPEDMANVEVDRWTPQCQTCLGSGSYLWYEDNINEKDVVVERNLFPLAGR